jgi:hypothetical protein
VLFAVIEVVGVVEFGFAWWGMLLLKDFVASLCF